MRRFVSISVVVLAACDRPAPPPLPPPPPVTPACTSAPTAPSPLRRLNRAEYDATVRDLLGDATRPARAFPPDEESQGFDNFAETQSVSPLLAEDYLGTAEALAAAADPIALAGCDPAVSGDAPCVQKLLAGFGRRTFRRPLSTDEVARLSAVFDAVRATENAKEALRAVVAVLLQSPQFLYRFEGAPLTPYELAARLSYFLWGSAPDDALLDAASQGAFDVGAQARRMLQDDRAKEVVRRFHLQWLGVAHLTALSREAPGFAALAPLMLEETARTAEWAVFDGNGDARRLFTGHTTFLNEALADHYGLTGFSGPTFVQADTDRTARIGVLTQGSVLSAWAKFDQTSPVLRGKLVRERFLCQSPAPPPGNVVAMIGTPDAGTTRERFAGHVSQPACSGCHQLLDPIGFGLEKYDATGAYRATENGTKVLSMGEVIAGGDLDGTFDGALELSARLAASKDVKRCLTRQWFRFAFGRAETGADACSVANAFAAFEKSGWNTRELLVALTQTEAFARSGR